MSRLTLRLPESLHQNLAARARREGVSLNQYLVYALTRQASGGYVIEPVPEEEVAAQEERFRALLDRLGPPATDEELRAALAAREPLRDEATSRSRAPG
jgi:uncharacterized protein (DUF1778 family)